MKDSVRILIDLQSCQSSGSRFRGIGRYTLNLIEAIASVAGDHELRLLLNDQLPDTIAPLYTRLSHCLAREQILVFQGIGPVAEINPDNSRRARRAELIREHAIAHLEPDLVLVTSLFEGYHDNVVTSIGRLDTGVSTAAMLYDLLPMDNPQFYLNGPAIRAHYDRKLAQLKRATTIFAISEYTRTQAITALQLDPATIVTLPPGLDACFYPRVLTPDAAKAVYQRLGIQRRPVLYTSGFDYRKNHPRLIAAYARLPDAMRRDHQLVLVGKGSADLFRHLRGVAQAEGLDADEVIFTGHIQDEELIALYNLCELFVYPSLAEGLGLPIMEAMACGAPTIAAKTTAIPEVIGRADALFDPSDTASISAKLHQALSQADFRRDLKAYGIARSADFSWHNTARAVLQRFEHIHHQSTTSQHKSSGALEDRLVKALSQHKCSQRERSRMASACQGNSRLLPFGDREQARTGWLAARAVAEHLPPAVEQWLGHPDQFVYLEFPIIGKTTALTDADWQQLRMFADHIQNAGIERLCIDLRTDAFPTEALGAWCWEMIATGRQLYYCIDQEIPEPLREVLTLCQPWCWDSDESKS